MYKHQLTPIIGPHNQAEAPQSLFASHRSQGYDLAQERLRSILRLASAHSMKEIS